ncbi:MAG TPA: zinc-ribbon domain-containing protein, partial [Kineosporiaceae bacterium]|nr:zinc-ribbon domain-containing protein [Kineosporiaceae bacterium]
MSVAVAAACPLCGEPVDAADVFCQACGAELKNGAGPGSAGSPSGQPAAASCAGAACSPATAGCPDGDPAEPGPAPFFSSAPQAWQNTSAASTGSPHSGQA